MKNSAFIFPGQGAQYLQMAKDFYDTFESARQTFEEAQDYLHANIVDLIFNGPLDTLTQTHNSQLAIYVTSIAILRVVQELYAIHPAFCAGLSLGEYSALTAAGWLSFQDGLALVKQRGLLMSEACENTPGTMAVIMGLNTQQVEECVAEVNLPHKLWIANYNCPGQIVISGTAHGVNLGSQQAKAKGAKRVLPLQVHGAFHSGLMLTAQEKLRPTIERTILKKTATRLVMNVPGDFVDDVDCVKQYLINQVTQSVRWQQGIEAIAKKGCHVFIEFGPGKTLAGMNQRIIGAEVPTLSIDKIAHLEQLNTII